jgi:hypothetical protein
MNIISGIMMPEKNWAFQERRTALHSTHRIFGWTSLPVEGPHNVVAGVHFFNMAVDMTQVVLLFAEVLMGAAHNLAIMTIETGTMNRATSAIIQLMVNIIITTPMMVTIEVTIWNRLWLSVLEIRSTSLVT